MSSKTSTKKPCKKSDKTKFEQDLIEETEVLRRFALKRTRDAAMADDLVQDTLVAALTNRDKFKMGTNLRGWLFTILKNTHLNKLRTAKRNRQYAEQVDVREQTIAPSQETHMELMDLGRAMTTLSESQREIILVHTFQSSGYNDTANRCGCKLGTVRSRLSRARSNLNLQMSPNGMGEQAQAA